MIFFAFSNGSIIPPSGIINHHAVVDAINDDDGILSFTVAIDHDVAEDALALNDLLQLNIFLPILIPPLEPTDTATAEPLLDIPDSAFKTVKSTA